MTLKGLDEWILREEDPASCFEPDDEVCSDCGCEVDEEGYCECEGKYRPRSDEDLYDDKVDREVDDYMDRDK